MHVRVQRKLRRDLDHDDHRDRSALLGRKLGGEGDAQLRLAVVFEWDDDPPVHDRVWTGLSQRAHGHDPTLRPRRSGPAQASVPVAQEELKTDRKSTRLNSSHVEISYAVFCLKKKKKKRISA